MLSLVDKTEEVALLGDQELIESLQRLLAQERGVHARLLVHLAEVDARGLYRERAYSSMFDYCVQALHMSEAEAYLRIRAARLSREFPRVLAMLQAGELHLSALKLLAPVLTRTTLTSCSRPHASRASVSSKCCWLRASKSPMCQTPSASFHRRGPHRLQTPTYRLRSKRPRRRKAVLRARRA